MKKLLPIAFLLTASFVTHSADTNDKHCRDVNKLAENVMLFRQEGVSVVRQMEMIECIKPSRDFKRLMEMMVEEAYKEPKFGSEEYKAEAITEFANNWYIQCKQANRNK
ncbi:hypothetical protein ABTC25_09335 [Acinetobacter baumannii]